MSATIIVTGDITSHGGTVISGDCNNTWYGNPIARLGDLVACPQLYQDGRPHGINKIIEGCHSLLLDGIPIALHGHRTECGCTLISHTNTHTSTNE